MSMETERRLIGAWLLQSALHTIPELRPDYFENQKNREAFKAVAKLRREGKPINPATVSDVAKGWTPSELDGLMLATPTSAEAETIAGSMKEAFERKEAFRVLSDLAKQAQEGADRGELFDVARARLERLEKPKGSWLDDVWAWQGAPEIQATPERREYLLESSDGGSFPKGRVGLLVGEGAAGKTWALCQLGLAIATGTPWLDTFKVKRPGRVLLALGEEETSEVQRRLHWASKGMDVEYLLDKPRILALPLAGRSIALCDRSGEETPFCRELRRRIEQEVEPFELLILDPLARFSGPEAEIDNHVATRVVETLESFTKLPGNPSVIVSHHTTKRSRQNQDEETSDARGATALTDGVRWVARLMPKAEGGAQFKVTKNNYGTHLVTKNNDGSLLVGVELERLERNHGVLTRKGTKDEEDDYDI